MLFMAVKPHCPVFGTQYKLSDSVQSTVNDTEHEATTTSSMLLYVHRDRKDGEPNTATSTLTQI